MNTLKLGQLRDAGTEIEGEKLEVRWFREGYEQPEFNDKFEIAASIGVWSVSVKFITPEVRHDPMELLYDSETFTVTFPVNSTLPIMTSMNLNDL